MLNVLGHKEFLVTGALAQGLLPIHLPKDTQGMVPQSGDELKYRVEKYLKQVKGGERKEANLKAIANVYIKQEEPVSCPNTLHRDRHDGGHDKHNQHFYRRCHQFRKYEHQKH